MNCKCYIGIINDYENTRMTTLDGLKIHIKESLELKPNTDDECRTYCA